MLFIVLFVVFFSVSWACGVVVGVYGTAMEGGSSRSGGEASGVAVVDDMTVLDLAEDDITAVTARVTELKTLTVAAEVRY